MTFGYYTFNWSLPQGFLVDQTWGIDNFKITIHQVPIGVEATTWTAIKSVFR